jgi:hypothetical protein
VDRSSSLLALVAAAILGSGCVSMLHPEPYGGSLKRDQVVRAILEEFPPPIAGLAVARRVSPDTSEVEQVSFTNAPRYRPAEGGTMVVLRVLDSWSYHTPDDASGMHEWLSVFNAELIATEMNESEAIAAARACLGASPDDASYNLENPFAFGPGARGGWTVRFSAPNESESAEIELDRSGRCAAR